VRALFQVVRIKSHHAANIEFHPSDIQFDVPTEYFRAALFATLRMRGPLKVTGHRQINTEMVQVVTTR
jgi:hypothetical protein